MERLEFLKQWYEREDDRRIALENSLSIPIGILTAIFAIQFFTLNEYNFEVASGFEMFCLIGLISLSILLALITTFFLFKSYHNLFSGFQYTGLPLPADLFKYEKDLVEYYRVNSDYYGEINGEAKFEEYLIDRYIEHTGRNSQNNDQKSNFLYKSKG